MFKKIIVWTVPEKVDNRSYWKRFGLYTDRKMHDNEDIELVAIFDNEQDKTKREETWRLVCKIEEEFNVLLICIRLQ